MRSQLPLILTFVAGVIPVIALFSPHPVMVRIASRADRWLVIMYAFAILLGVVSVVQSNTKKIARRDRGWPYAIVLLAGLTVMGGFGILANFGIFGGITTVAGRPTPFQWCYSNVFLPLQATMFSLLAFYMASASFRAFRARNLAAGLLMISAIIVMFGRIPVGEAVPFVPMITEWIMDNPNAAAQRGIIIGAALGAASMSLRVILGIERSHLGLGKGE
jgi:hypothetical protein